MRTSRLAFAMTLVSGLVSACTGQPEEPVSSASSPIVGGTIDNGDPAVVLIGGHGSWSTGTLVSPKVVLTCGHCVNGAAREFVWFGTDYVQGSGTRVSVAQYYPYPGYAGDQNADIGIVVLDQCVDVTPVSFDQTPLDASIVGSQERLVGFGQTENPNEFLLKKDRTVTVASLPSETITVGEGICFGDSGGPGIRLAGGTEVIDGVIASTGSGTCTGNGALARVDLYSDWIQAQIDAAGACTAGSDGGVSDAGSSDGGSVDAGTTDAGTTDAGTTNAGATDAGSSDGGRADSGVSDAGSSGGGSADGAIANNGDSGVSMPPDNGGGCGCRIARNAPNPWAGVVAIGLLLAIGRPRTRERRLKKRSKPRPRKRPA